MRRCFYSLSRRLYLVAAVAISVLVPALTSFESYADFDEATKAYLLGNYEKARYESLVAAADGNPKAQMLLGQLYFNGEGVEKNTNHALYWYEKAASSNFMDAQFRLGMLYYDGKNGIKKDLDKSYAYLNQALDAGYKEAKLKLEWLYKTEQGKVVNLRESPEVLKQVASTGNKQARFLLSQNLIKGVGVPQDKASGVKMLTEDAKQGFIKAQKRLGELYFYGEGVPEDFIEAYGWSMAYAGTKELGGISREGKQTARSALRKLAGDKHNDAYLKSKQYFDKYVLPFYANAREVGPDKYRVVVSSRKPKAPPAKKRLKQQKNVASKEDVKPSNSATAPVLGLTSKVRPGLVAKENSNSPVPSVVVDKKSNVPIEKPATGKVLTKLPKENSTSNIIVGDKPKVNKVKPLGGLQNQEDAKIGQQSDSNNLANSLTESAQVPLVLELLDASLNGAEAIASLEDDVDAQPVELAERNFQDVYNLLVRKKAGLNQLYKREFELDKKLQGRVVFEIVVEPAGNISAVEIISNELESPTLAQEFIDYFKNSVKFKNQDVAEFKITYPVDFSPP